MARAGVSTDEEVSGPEGETNGRPSGAKTESWLHYNVFQCIGAVVVAPWLLLDRGYCGFLCSDAHLYHFGRQFCRDPCDGSRVSMRGWTDWAPFRILVIAALLYLGCHTDFDGLLHHVLCVSDWVGEAIVWTVEHVWHAPSRARQAEGMSAPEDGGTTHGRTAEREGGSGSDGEEEGKLPDMDRLDDCARSMAHILRLSDDALRALILQKVPEADVQQVLGLLHKPRAQVASAAGLPTGTETAVLQNKAHSLAFFLCFSDHALRRIISRTAPRLDVEREVGVVRWVRRLVESCPIEASTPSPSPRAAAYSHALSILFALSDDELRALLVQRNIPETHIAPLLALVRTRAAQPEGHPTMSEGAIAGTRVHATGMSDAVLPPQELHLPSSREGGGMQAEAREEAAQTPREGATTALDEDSLGALEGQVAAAIASILGEAVQGSGQQRSLPSDLQAPEPLEEEEEGSEDEQPEVPQGTGPRAGQPPRRKHMRTGPINRRQPFGPGVRTPDRTGMRILDLSPETLARLNRLGVLPHVSARVPPTESLSTNASTRPLERATQLVSPAASLVQTGGASNDPSRTLPRPLSASPAWSQQAASRSASSTSAVPIEPSRIVTPSTVAPQSLQTTPTPAIPPVTSTERPMAWPVPYVPLSLGPRTSPQISSSQPITSISGAPLNPSTAPTLQATPGAVTNVSPRTPAQSLQTAPPPIAQAPSPLAIGLSQVTQLTLDSILAARRRMASRLPAAPSIPQVTQSIIEQPSALGEDASGQPEVAIEAEGIDATSETSVEGEDKPRRRRRRRKKRQLFIPLDDMEKKGEEEQEEDEEEEEGEDRVAHIDGQAAKTEERSPTPAQQVEAASGQEALPQEEIEEMPGGRMQAEADSSAAEEGQRALFALYEQLHELDVEQERLSRVMAARENLRKESTPVAQQVGPSTSATADTSAADALLDEALYHITMATNTARALVERPQLFPPQARPPPALPPQGRMAPPQTNLPPPGLLQEPPAIRPSALAHLPASPLHLPPPGLPLPPTLPLPRPVRPPRPTPVRIQSFGFLPLPSPFPWGSLQATRGPLLSYVLRPRPPSPFLRPRPFLPTRPPLQSYTWLPYPSRHPWPRNMGSWYASYKTPTSRAPIGTSPSRFPNSVQPGPTRLYSPFGSSFPGLGPQAVGYANATQPGAQDSGSGTSYQSTAHAANRAPEATVVACDAGQQEKVMVKEEEKEDEEEGEGAAEKFVRLVIDDEADTKVGKEEEGQGIPAVVGEGPHVPPVSEPHDQNETFSDSQAATAGEESETISFTWELDEGAAREPEEEGGEPLFLRFTGGSDSETDVSGDASDDSGRGRNAVEVEVLSSVPSSPRDGSDKGSAQVPEPAAYHHPRSLRIPCNYHDSSQIQSGATPAAVATVPPPAASSPPVAQTTEQPQAIQPAASNPGVPAATPEPPAAKLSRQEVRRAARAAQKQAARDARLHGLPPPAKAQSSYEPEQQAELVGDANRVQAPIFPPSFARGPLPTVNPALMHLHCPASHRLLTDPIIAGDGVTYARSAFKEHITYCYQSGQPYTSLMDNQTVLPSLVILPNLFARRQVQEYQRRLREGR